MIQLSYSSLSLLHERPHCWLNKTMGIPQPQKPEWEQGKKIHRIIQDHVSGKKFHPYLKHIKYKFEIVEEKDFDERCRFEFCFSKKYKNTYELCGKTLESKLRDDYGIIGFYDGLNKKKRQFLEIKSSDPLWSLVKFQKSIQRKLYALSNSWLTEAILIACSKDESRWEKELPKVFKVPLTEQDREDAIEWILEGIKILENGQFLSDLTEMPDGSLRCLDPRCFWGENCNWK